MKSLAHFLLASGSTVVASSILSASLGASIATAKENPTRAAVPATSAVVGAPEETVAPYEPRFNRTRPVIAVIGENSRETSTTELTDFVVPYGILAQSGAAQVIAVSTHAGPLRMRPALVVQPQADIAAFDAKYPDGADYVIVPAVSRIDDADLLGWIGAQGKKGSTIVSICDGALVVANTGLMDGHRATAHWDTEDLRAMRYPRTQWVRNIRYVADGKIVSSAGISAAIPVSLALVEAIAGHARAVSLGEEIGIARWTSVHDSDVFRPRFGSNLMVFARTNYTNGWFHSTQAVGVPMEAGVDEIALALTVDAWSRTGRSRAYPVSSSAQPVTSRHGLVFLAQPIAAASKPSNLMLGGFDGMLSAQALDRALLDIAKRYGRMTAYGVALDFEYPGFAKHE